MADTSGTASSEIPNPRSVAQGLTTPLDEADVIEIEYLTAIVKRRESLTARIGSWVS